MSKDFSTFVAFEFSDADFQGMETLDELFRYQGLDLVVVYNTLKSKEKDPLVFQRDMNTFAKWLSMRGTNIKSTNRSFNKSTDEGKKRITDLATKYGIKTDTAPTKAEDVSMGRVAAVIAYQIAQVNAKAHGQGGARVIGTLPDDLPSYLAFPAAGALIPRTETLLVSAWKSWYLSFTSVATKTPMTDSLKGIQEPFMDAILASALVSPAVRPVVLSKLARIYRNYGSGKGTTAAGSSASTGGSG